MGDLLKERLQSVGHSADPLEVLPVEHTTGISISHAPLLAVGLPCRAKEKTNWGLAERDRSSAGHVVAKHK